MAISELDQEGSAGLDEPAPVKEEEEEEDGATMSLVEHLEELRRRIIICAVTIVVGSIVGFIFWQPILHFLLIPLPAAADALAHGPNGTTIVVVNGDGEAFSVVLNLSVAVWFFLVSPIILYQLWAFEKASPTPFTTTIVVPFGPWASASAAAGKGISRKCKMGCQKMKPTILPTTIVTAQMIMRRRSSSRCSTRDIVAPSSSSSSSLTGAGSSRPAAPSWSSSLIAITHPRGLSLSWLHWRQE